MKRLGIGLVVALLIPAATSTLLIRHAKESAATGSVPQSLGSLWLLVWAALAVVSVLLGRATRVPAAAAAGIAALGVSLGAILKAADAPDAVGAILIATVSFVVMTGAAAGLSRSGTSRDLAIACAFWLLGACMLAGTTWNCAICAGARRCRIAWAAPLLLSVLAGCGSSRLPPPMAPADLSVPEVAYIGGSVAVERDQYPVYSDRLIEQLSQTGLFDQVASIEKVPEPTFIARVERHVHGRAVIPIWTALSLGLIPMVFTEEHGFVFSLRLPSDERAVIVDASYSGRTTLGWLALFVNASPDYSVRRPEKTERFRWYFRRATAAKALELIERRNPP